MAAAGAEISDTQVFEGAEFFNLFPEFRHGAGIEDFELEPPHGAKDGAATQFHQDRERRNFPEHDLGP